jgi:hypothetical protein
MGSYEIEAQRYLSKNNQLMAYCSTYSIVQNIKTHYLLILSFENKKKFAQ